MSFAKLEEITCPCGETFEAELWNAINVGEDPDLKEAILSGEVNVVCCPSCGQIFYAEHFILYQDGASELLAFVYPTSFSQQASYCATKMKEDFERAMKEFLPEQRMNYQPILIFGLETLVGMIREEEELNEVSILEYSAKDLGLSLLRLHPSLARKRQLPRILPLLKEHNQTPRQDLIGGLKRLIDFNPHLTHFKNILQSVEHNEQWKLDEEMVKSK
jgi:hypothetical protein